MNQEELLNIIIANPGIKQSELNGNKQVRQLLKRREITRVSVPTRHGTTFRLYPNMNSN